MKKIVTVILSAILLLSLVNVVYAEDYTVDFSTMNSTCGYRDTGKLRGNNDAAISGLSVRMNSENDASGADWYRRTYLTSFGDNVTIVPDTYVLTFWVFDEHGVLSDGAWTADYYLTFHNSSQTNETVEYKLNDSSVTNVKILLFDPSTGAGIMKKTGNKVVKGGKNWVEYQATIEVPCEVTRFAFWIYQVKATSKSETIYIDDMTLKGSNSTSEEITTAEATTTTDITTVTETTTTSETTTATTTETELQTEKTTETNDQHTDIGTETTESASDSSDIGEETEGKTVKYIIIGISAAVAVALIAIIIINAAKKHK